MTVPFDFKINFLWKSLVETLVQIKHPIRRCLVIAGVVRWFARIDHGNGLELGCLFCQNSVRNPLFSIYYGQSHHQNWVLVDDQNPESKHHQTQPCRESYAMPHGTSNISAHASQCVWRFMCKTCNCGPARISSPKQNLTSPSAWQLQWCWCCPCHP
jgi:hypothetical protein